MSQINVMPEIIRENSNTNNNDHNNDTKIVDSSSSSSLHHKANGNNIINTDNTTTATTTTTTAPTISKTGSLSSSSNSNSAISNSLPSLPQYDQQQQQHHHHQHRFSNEQFQYPPLPPSFLSDQRASFNFHPPLPSIPPISKSNSITATTTTNFPLLNQQQQLQQQQQYMHYPLNYDPNQLPSQQSLQIYEDRKLSINYSNNNNNTTNTNNSRSKSDPLLLPILSQSTSSSYQQEPNVITQKDIKIIKTLLPISETHKWKYLSHRVSKMRSKKFSSEFVKVKYHEIFGLPYSNHHKNSDTKYNIEGLIGSSVPYLVFDTNSIDNRNNIDQRKAN